LRFGGQIETLSDIQCQPESQLKFITEAWLQVNDFVHFSLLWINFGCVLLALRLDQFFSPWGTVSNASVIHKLFPEADLGDFFYFL
jgi:hypothetical protein